MGVYVIDEFMVLRRDKDGSLWVECGRCGKEIKAVRRKKGDLLLSLQFCSPECKKKYR